MTLQPPKIQEATEECHGCGYYVDLPRNYTSSICAMCESVVLPCSQCMISDCQNCLF